MCEICGKNHEESLARAKAEFNAELDSLEKAARGGLGIGAALALACDLGHRWCATTRLPLPTR